MSARSFTENSGQLFVMKITLYKDICSNVSNQCGGGLLLENSIQSWVLVGSFFCYFGLMLQAVYIDFCCFLSSAQTGIEIERVALALFCLWSILTAQQVGLSFLFIPTMRTILCEGANLKVSEEKIYKRF